MNEFEQIDTIDNIWYKKSLFFLYESFSLSYALIAAGRPYMTGADPTA